MSNENELVLYNYFRSSASWRVRIALEHKGINYEYRAVNLAKEAQFNPEFMKINPLGQVPALLHNGELITQSMAILEYLEEIFPQKPLLPKDPVTRAKIRQICEIIGSGIQPLQNNSVAAKVTDDGWRPFWIERGFTALEKILEGSRGRYCVGDELSLADCFLVPQVYSGYRYNADMTKFPVSVEIYENLRELEAFKKANALVQIDCPKELREK